MVSDIRAKRIESQMQKDLGTIFARLKDRDLALVTITSVTLQGDMKLATVKVIASGNPESVMNGLTRAKGFIKRELAPLLGLRYMPDIKFEYDKGIEYEQYMSKLLDGLRDEENSSTD